METGRLVIMGMMDTVEPDPTGSATSFQHHPMALLIEFDSAESIGQAIKDGACKFIFGDSSTPDEVMEK